MPFRFGISFWPSAFGHLLHFCDLSFLKKKLKTVCLKVFIAQSWSFLELPECISVLKKLTVCFVFHSGWLIYSGLSAWKLAFSETAVSISVSDKSVVCSFTQHFREISLSLSVWCWRTCTMQVMDYIFLSGRGGVSVIACPPKGHPVNCTFQKKKFPGTLEKEKEVVAIISMQSLSRAAAPSIISSACYANRTTNNITKYSEVTLKWLGTEDCWCKDWCSRAVPRSIINKSLEHLSCTTNQKLPFKKQQTSCHPEAY